MNDKDFWRQHAAEMLCIEQVMTSPHTEMFDRIRKYDTNGWRCWWHVEGAFAKLAKVNARL